MAQWARKDEAATRAARKTKEFLDRRSWKGWRKDGTPFIRLHGRDKTAQRERLWGLSNGHCANCQVFLLFYGGELDHIRSLGRGGDDTDKNLQWLCRPCHERKHNRSIHLHTIPQLAEGGA